LSNLAEEILSFVSKKGKIEAREIQERFNLTKETATTVINFLVEFGFAELDESKRYVRLSEPCKKFLEEDTNQSQNRDERLTLMLVYL